MIRDHDAVRQFLGDVCLHIKAREAHADIRRELLGHIEELTQEKESEGFSREDSVRWAVSQMGDPATIGSGLHKVHRPRMHWGLLLATLGFAILGVFVMYLFEISLNVSHPGTSLHYFMSKTAVVAIGLLVMGFFYFWDYRKLRRFSWPLYGIVIAGMLFTNQFGQQINGARNFIALGSFAIDWISTSPYLLVLSAAGILPNWRSQRNIRLSYLAFVIVPLFFYLITPNFAALLLYLSGYLAIYGAVTKRWIIAWLQTAGTLIAGAILAILSKKAYFAQRLSAYWNPGSDPNGSGYMTLQMKKAIMEGGWWGQGLASQLPRRLPSLPNELVYVYIMHCFGWLAGAAIAVGVVYFVSRVAQSSREVHEPYGKLTIIGMTALLGFQMGYSMLMSFGTVPLTGMPFPLVSYGGSHLLAELAAIGLILGIYRRKDLVRCGHSNVS